MGVCWSHWLGLQAGALGGVYWRCERRGGLLLLKEGARGALLRCFRRFVVAEHAIVEEEATGGAVDAMEFEHACRGRIEEMDVTHVVSS